MSYIEEIKKTFMLMNIKEAIIIDDDLNVQDKNKEVIYDILEGKHDDEEFSIQDELDALELQLDEVTSSLDDDILAPELLNRFKDVFPDLFKSRIDLLISVLNEIFDGKITLKDKAKDDDEFNNITEETIVFLDYNLEGSPLESHELTKLLSKHDLNSPLLIVFISTNEEFYLEKENHPFNMEMISDRNKYFRGLRNQQLTSQYKNSLYEYINKGKLNQEETTLKSLYEISQNLYGGQRFFKLLGQIQEILMQSSADVLGKFHLLNSRSLQELLIEKVALEGESESAFLLNWISRNISKSVTKNDTLTQNIHHTLEEIGQWSTPFNELHEDEALKEIVRDEMWDSTIKERHVPIDFGDVFEIIYNNESYKALLITQPCTIAVRGDGNRSGNLATLVLEEKKKKKGDSLAIVEDWNGDQLIFDLNTTINIPFELLDLTTLDKNGFADLIYEETHAKKIPQLPKQVLWSKGYTKMINKLTSRMLSEIDETKELLQFGYMWIPFTKNGNKYKFPIERKSRLDTYYTLFVLQKLQSWSGRIGLPLDVKFMNDYEKKIGKILINEIENEAELYIKQSNDGIKDIAVSVDILESLLLDIYKENLTYITVLKEIFKSTELLKYNYSSGERLVSLVKSTDAINLLGKQNIHISVQKDQLFIDITVCEFTKCLLNGDDVTTLFTNFNLDTRGNLRYHLETTLVEKLNLNSQIPHYEKRVEDKGKGIKIIKMDSNLGLFEHNIKGDILEITYSGEVAATIED